MFFVRKENKSQSTFRSFNSTDKKYELTQTFII